MESPPAGTFRSIYEGLYNARSGNQKGVGRHPRKVGDDGSRSGQQCLSDAMTVANPLEDAIEIGFADGAHGCIPYKPYKDIPEIEERTALSSLANPYEMVLETVGDEMVEIPWDFARHYCDASYRPAIEAIAMQGRQILGECIRGFRESAGLTQAALAQTADIGRVTLVRLEKGAQSPRFKTLDAIARVLGRHATNLLVEPESLFVPVTQYPGAITSSSGQGRSQVETSVND